MILDLFAGPGGWDEGMRSIGITDVVGVEWDESACLTRSAAGHRTIRADVAEYPTEPFEGRTRGLIASPPCTAFSMAGRGDGREALPLLLDRIARRDWSPLEGHEPPVWLALQVGRWVEALRPRWIACEQVPPALVLWEAYEVVLRDMGYSTWSGVLNSADYGVPQTRRRAILMASLDGPAHPPEPTHAEKPEPSLFGAKREPWVSMSVALGWKPGSRSWDRRVGGFAADAETIPDTRPAPTITSFGLLKGKDVWRNADGEIERVLMQEASVLQGFPADYPWQGSKTKQFEQVGNAVPPPLAAAIIGALEGVQLERRAA